ncbi:MAG: hypothetical protein GY765_24725, partial [bacterium]|nr:hypothetical protein [bacterium]
MDENETGYLAEMEKSITENFRGLKEEHLTSQKALQEYVHMEMKGLVQSLFNKIVDRLEDPAGRYGYKTQASFIKGMIGIYDHIGELERCPWSESEQQHAKNYTAIRRQLFQVFLMHELEPE